MIFMALIILVLVSSSRTTYLFGPVRSAQPSAAAWVEHAAHAQQDEPRRACPWPRRVRHFWPQQAAADRD